MAGAGSGSPVMDYRAAVAARPIAPASVGVSYGEINGLPAVIISDDDMAALAKPFEFTLVGKFLVDRPPLSDIRKFIVRLRLFGFVKVDKHDMRNVVFRFADERDYMRFFARRMYRVFGVDMRVTKWSPFVDVSEELPIVPLWISFPGLRYQLYHLKTLLDIAKVFGKPLCVDSNTAMQGDMVQARVLVEVDVSVNHPSQIWLGSQGKGAPQDVIIEKLPFYCEVCKKMGHAKGECGNREPVVGCGGPQWIPKLPSQGLGSDGGSPLVKGCASEGGGNHSGSAEGPNFSNYVNFVETCRTEEARTHREASKAGNLTNIINEILGVEPNKMSKDGVTMEKVFNVDMNTVDNSSIYAEKSAGVLTLGATNGMSEASSDKLPRKELGQLEGGAAGRGSFEKLIDEGGGVNTVPTEVVG